MVEHAPVAVLSLRLTREIDVVLARQRGRQIANLLGFDNQDQVRIATAISEIARNALQYGSGGQVEYLFHISADPQRLDIRVSDHGRGIDDLPRILDGRYQSHTGSGIGIVGARRLMDAFAIETSENGTTVTLTKLLPAIRPALDRSSLSDVVGSLTEGRPQGAWDEIRQQNHELLQALDELRKRTSDLAHLRQELDETNRGVLALYAELDDRAASLRRADEVKSHFLSHMSHEFRTPLNSVLALARLLQEETDGPLNSEQQRQIGYIRSAALELFDMVNDLLDMSKVQAGRVEVHIGEVNIARVFGALRGIMRPLKQNDAVRLVIEEPEEWLVFFTDEGKLSQILRNLISNALKFTESGEVRLSMSVTDGTAVFAVSDTGIGIPLEHQQRIFQEFAQVDNPIQARVKGTGLGLPLSRKLAELLGGTLSVRSEPNAGSTFFLCIPATAAERRPVRHEGLSPVVLIVDDDERSRYLLRQLFNGAPYAVSEAATGSEGLERARFERPDLIFLDLHLPDYDGFQVLADLRADRATSTIPVIIHTGLTVGSAELARLSGRHDAILPKAAMGTGEATAMLDALLRAWNLPGLAPA